MKRYYAGIGSRQTPEPILHVMRRLGYGLALRGYTLRSGAADGADSAFEQGCDSTQGSKEIWLPWPGFNHNRDSKLTPEAMHFELAATLHPTWGYLKDGPKALHARNTAQVLGADLHTPVDFVVCFTPDGAQTHEEVNKGTGGTGTAIRLASLRGIPVFNLFRIETLEKLKAFISATAN